MTLPDDDRQYLLNLVRSLQNDKNQAIVLLEKALLEISYTDHEWQNAARTLIALTKELK